MIIFGIQFTNLHPREADRSPPLESVRSVPTKNSPDNLFRDNVNKFSDNVNLFSFNESFCQPFLGKDTRKQFPIQIKVVLDTCLLPHAYIVVIKYYKSRY